MLQTGTRVISPGNANLLIGGGRFRNVRHIGVIGVPRFQLKASRQR